MPTLRQLVKQMTKIESQSDGEPGAYPIMFKSEVEKAKFVMLLKWEHFKMRVKKLWTK